MADVSLFSEETLTNFFRSNFNLDTQENLKYIIKKCSVNKNILCFDVSSENEDFNLEYLMVKVLDKENIDKKKLEYASILGNVFTIQDDNGDVYLVFNKKHISYPSRNSLENLTTIMTSLAEFQVKYLATPKEQTIKSSEYKVQDLYDTVVSMDFFKDLDHKYSSYNILRFQEELNELLDNSLIVKSIGNIFATNIFITATGKCVLLDLGHGVFKSPVYDVLLIIFALTDETFRQRHLKMLLNIYYSTFIATIKELDNTIVLTFNANVFEMHVKLLLPIVKFETAIYLLRQEKSDEEERILEELLNNILYSLKYHQLSYEDCLEAVCNKVGSTDFKIMSYQLAPLDEKLGHLGEYFILNSTVNYSGKNEEFSMFLKLLNIENSSIKEIVQSGASKREQFFFRTLIPLFKQNNLQLLIDFAPACYFDRLNDVVILENLAKLGYKSLKPDAKVGYDFMRTAFLKAAKFHACSLILEERMSKNNESSVRLGDIYGEFLEDWVFTVREGLPKTPVNVVNAKPGLDELIDSFADISKDISVEEFHKRADNLYDMFLERVNLPSKQFRNVICHGDLYSSNLLVNYNQNNTIEDCFLIDFQTLRYVPITQDILMLAYCSSHKDVRDTYLDKLLEEYYEELKKILCQYDLNIDNFYTPEKFRECVNYMKPAAIIAAINYAQVIAIPPEKKDVFYCEEKFKYYLFDNRKEYIKLFLTFSEDLTLYMKGLITDLYDICVNN